MILTNTIEIEVYGRKVKHYESLGYEIPRIRDNNYRMVVPKGTKLTVRIEDMPPTSRDEVPYKCDYCGGKFIKKYVEITKGRKIVPKDCCENCIPLKKRDVNLAKYGVEHTMQLEEIKIKFKESMLKNHGVEFASQSPVIREKITASYLEKYGETNPMKSKEIKDRYKETMIHRYGVTSALQNQEFKDKTIQTNRLKYGVDNPQQNKEIKEKTMITMNKNGTIAISLQQQYIHSLIGGELNHLFGVSAIDIAFPDEKIYVEYDGGGHWLSVSYGTITEHEFNLKEIRRSYALQSNGWKEIRIISRKDKLPSDEKLIQMMDFAREYLNTGRHYIKFDIDNGIVIASQFEKEYDYDKLRKITKQDIETLNKINK